MNGSAITVKCLRSLGVDTVFGYPGGSILPLIDAIAADGHIDLIVNTHEQFCAFAADGYARSSGKVGVCLATSGPGATNLVTGIANAYMDSIPVVAITGNVPTTLLGTDAFQEIDIAGVTMPITKHNFIVKSVESLVPTLVSAFAIASGGRKGPVLVDIPSDIFVASCAYKKYSYNMPVKSVEGDVHAVARLINESEHPFICVGGGVISAGAGKVFSEFAHRLSAPVASTAMGIGAFDGSDPLYCGLFGVNASEKASELFEKCDLMIAIGTRFSDRMLSFVRTNKNCKVIHIDIDGAEIDKNLSPCGALTGDAGDVLGLLTPLVNKRCHSGKAFVNEPKTGVFSLINKYFPDSIYTTEVGLHQVSACKNLAVRYPRQFLTSGGLGAMGFGLPAAIGASVANKKQVVVIAGDGSFNMNMQELATAVKYKLPITVIIINNRSLGMIESWQKREFGGRIVAADTPAIDYMTLGRSFGADVYRAESIVALEEALAQSSGKRAVALIEYLTEEPL